MRLKDKTAIITGAGRGIGRGIALRLAREGCNIIIADLNFRNAINVAKEVKTSGRESLAIKVNVAVAAQVKKMVDKTIEKFRRIDILVNNAGITIPAPIEKLTEEIWDRTININLKGTYLCSREVAKYMIKKKRGKIINISSKSGKSGGLWLSAYCASKFGVIGFTQSLALDLASCKINVNAVCPGIIFTPQWEKLDLAYARKLKIPAGRVRDYYVKKIPLGREATAEDVANIVLFLASKESDYMTGQAINVTGGQEMR